MGNYRFRLSNMMPNVWFYKLKYMTRGHGIPKYKKRSHTPPTTKTTPRPQQPYLPNRSSCYTPSKVQAEKFSSSPLHPKASDTHFPIDPPSKTKRKTQTRPSARPHSSAFVSSDCTYRTTRSLQHHHDHKDTNDDLCRPIVAPNSHTCGCMITSSSADIIFDIESSIRESELVSQHHLPPILTKPMKKVAEKTEQIRATNRNSSVKEQRTKIQMSSTRLSSRRIHAQRKSNTGTTEMVAMQQGKGLFDDSFAIMKSSSDPQKDFRESMVEMIVENNIRASKDLEKLLACYLSLGTVGSSS